MPTCWLMEYHIEHHMYPAVPFYNLKKLRAALAPYLPERKSLAGAWREIAAYLKKRKTDPGYYTPVPDLKEIPAG